MKSLWAAGVLLLLTTSCGSTFKPEKIQSFKTSQTKRPTSGSPINEIVTYNVMSGALVIRHEQRDASATILDSNFQILTGERKHRLDVILSSLVPEELKETYRWNGYTDQLGASDSEGPSLQVTLTSESEDKPILIDTTDTSIMPPPLAALYDKALNLEF